MCLPICISTCLYTDLALSVCQSVSLSPPHHFSHHAALCQTSSEQFGGSFVIASCCWGRPATSCTSCPSLASTPSCPSTSRASSVCPCTALPSSQVGQVKTGQEGVAWGKSEDRKGRKGELDLWCEEETLEGKGTGINREEEKSKKRWILEEE